MICRNICHYELSIMSKYEGHSFKALGARITYLITRMAKLTFQTFSAAACAIGSILGVLQGEYGYSVFRIAK